MPVEVSATAVHRVRKVCAHAVGSGPEERRGRWRPAAAAMPGVNGPVRGVEDSKRVLGAANAGMRTCGAGQVPPAAKTENPDGRRRAVERLCRAQVAQAPVRVVTPQVPAA